MVDLSVKIGSIILKNPILNASGTFGYGTELNRFYDVSNLGGIITKTITLKSREGNPAPRIAETPCGLLNSIGLANVGVEEFLSDKIPLLESIRCPVIVNIAGNDIADYIKITQKLECCSRIDGIEVNISCPNIKKGGMAFGTDPDITYNIVSKIRHCTDRTLIVKLTPNVTDIISIAKAAVAGGADSLSLINTIVGMGIDIYSRRPVLGKVMGGLSGPAIKPIALAKVYQVAQNVDVPVIGIGGIMKFSDVIEFLIAGASAVEIGTLNFIDPIGVINLISDIEKFFKSQSINNMSEIINTILT